MKEDLQKLVTAFWLHLKDKAYDDEAELDAQYYIDHVIGPAIPDYQLTYSPSTDEIIIL